MYAATKVFQHPAEVVAGNLDTASTLTVRRQALTPVRPAALSPEFHSTVAPSQLVNNMLTDFEFPDQL